MHPRLLRTSPLGIPLIPVVLQTMAVAFAKSPSPTRDVLGEVRASGDGLLPSAQFFKQMGVRCDRVATQPLHR